MISEDDWQWSFHHSVASASSPAIDPALFSRQPSSLRAARLACPLPFLLVLLAAHSFLGVALFKSLPNGRKIWPLSKKICPYLQKLHLCDSISSKYDKILKPYQYQNLKIPGFLKFHKGKCRIQNILNIWPLFGHFWENSALILPQICTAAYIFTRPL
jgi:hypothetical protein